MQSEDFDLTYLHQLINEDLYLIKSEITYATEPLIMEEAVAYGSALPKSTVSIPKVAVAPKSEVASDKDIDIEFLGKNLKNVLIIIENKEKPFPDTKEMDLLIKIMMAVKLTIEDVAIVNFWKSPYNYEDLYCKFKFNQLIAFVDSPSALKASFKNEKYKVQSVDNTKILFSDSLKELDSNIEKKKLLWKNLQGMF